MTHLPYPGAKPNFLPRTFRIGEIVPAEEAAWLLGSATKGGGWFKDGNGREVYICDGSHRDGTRGFKVLQFDGLK
jgi:hypothetical protein